MSHYQTSGLPPHKTGPIAFIVLCLSKHGILLKMPPELLNDKKASVRCILQTATDAHTAYSKSTGSNLTLNMLNEQCPGSEKDVFYQLLPS